MASSHEEAEILIQRPTYTKHQFHMKYKIPMREERKIGLATAKTRIKSFVGEKKREPCNAVKSFLFGLFPILVWFPNYRVKDWLGSDIISGVTIGIMQIPQG